MKQKKITLFLDYRRSSSRQSHKQRRFVKQIYFLIIIFFVLFYFQLVEEPFIVFQKPIFPFLFCLTTTISMNFQEILLNDDFIIL